MRKLKKGETIVTAYAEPCAGPGWSNAPIWVIVRGPDQKLREDSIQPSERTDAMNYLYPTSAMAHAQMVKAVEAKMLPGRSKR